MKIICCLMAVLLLLTGCSTAETFETLADVYAEGAAEPKEVVLTVPENSQVISSAAGELYLCDGFDIAVEILAGDSLEDTLRQVSGFGPDDLTVMETAQMGLSRYEWVWTAAGEGGDALCRSVLLDDGSYHYCITVMAPAAEAGKLTAQWQALLGGISLA